jgi:uncharacterized protein (TIGR02145 family)
MKRKKMFLTLIIGGILLMLLISCKSCRPDPVKDIDGNIYQTVRIGNQVWMAENLKVMHYRNGDKIPLVIDRSVWKTLTTGAYCNYNNDVNNAGVYGNLYNWYAATDSRNLCPTDWHIPTDAEWKTLIDYLGGENLAGGKMKETGTAHWTSPNGGADNSSGFSALPGGFRSSGGPNEGVIYDQIGNYGFWWSSTEGSNNQAWYRSINHGYPYTYRVNISKQYGFSIRCVRDY